MPIYEPGLEEMVARNVDDGRLTFTTDLPAGVRQSDVIFIAVGTPPRESGETDLSHVEAVAAEIGRTMDRYKVVVNKSTVPVGTGELVREVVARHQPTPIDFDVVSNPEFLREGSAIEDTLRPDRIVIGAPNQHAAMRLVELYAPLERPMIITDLPSAEVIKYASNAFLAAKISFINAIANICESAGADVTQVMKGMGLDNRIGGAFLQAGLGYGGSCFPKDVDSLIHTAGRLGYDFKLLKSVVEINRERAARLVEMVRKVLGPMDDKTVAVLGLAVQAQYRRHARGQERRGDPAAPRRRRHHPRLRSRWPPTMPTPSSPRRDLQRLPLRGGPGRRRGGARHRVERVQVPQPRAAAERPPPARHLRRPQYLGARAHAPARLRVLLDRAQARDPGLRAVPCACS